MGQSVSYNVWLEWNESKMCFPGLNRWYINRIPYRIWIQSGWNIPFLGWANTTKTRHRLQVCFSIFCSFHWFNYLFTGIRMRFFSTLFSECCQLSFICLEAPLDKSFWGVLWPLSSWYQSIFGWSKMWLVECWSVWGGGIILTITESLTGCSRIEPNSKRVVPVAAMCCPTWPMLRSAMIKVPKLLVTMLLFSGLRCLCVPFCGFSFSYLQYSLSIFIGW